MRQISTRVCLVLGEKNIPGVVSSRSRRPEDAETWRREGDDGGAV